MAIEYDLILAGDPPVELVAERALPDSDERPAGSPPLLSAYLDDRYGFGVDVLAGKDRYISVVADGGGWEWEPKLVVTVGFRLNKSASRGWAVTNMLAVVARLLTTGTEDAALVLNGDVLLLSRLGGRLVKYNRLEWWAAYPGADAIVPG